jgi:hypothetical protein
MSVCHNLPQKATTVLSGFEHRTGEQKVWHQANVPLTIRPSKLALINILDVPLQLPGQHIRRITARQRNTVVALNCRFTTHDNSENRICIVWDHDC